MPRRPKNPRAGVPLPAPYARLIDRDAQFGHRMRAWREEQGVTQDRLRELLEQHTDYQPESTTSVSRLELGKAWPNLWVVEAMARLDATVAGGGGRVLSVSNGKPCALAGHAHSSSATMESTRTRPPASRTADRASGPPVERRAESA